MKRVDSIAAYLNKSDADILILQEVFHKRARKRLSKLLESKYPDQTMVGPKTIWGVPSGVMICGTWDHLGIGEFHRSFNNGTGSDNLADKGIIMNVYKIDSTMVNIIGTHLQAGGGGKREKIRMEQLDIIKKLNHTIADSEVVIYAGDFNIDYNSNFYDSIEVKLNSTNLLPDGALKHTANFTDHDLMNSEGTPKWIDFILLRRSEWARISDSRIEEPRQIIDDQKERLSDHNPIISTIVITSQ